MELYEKLKNLMIIFLTGLYEAKGSLLVHSGSSPIHILSTRHETLLNAFWLDRIPSLAVYIPVPQYDNWRAYDSPTLQKRD